MADRKKTIELKKIISFMYKMSKQDEIRLKYAGLIADAVTHMRNLLDYRDTVKDPKKVVFYNQEKDTADKVKEPRQLSVLEPTIYWRFPLIIQLMRMLSQDPAVAQDDRPYYYNEILTQCISSNIASLKIVLMRNDIILKKLSPKHNPIHCTYLNLYWILT